jgi:hypothetical protein
MSYREDFKVRDALQSLYGLGKLVSDYVFTGNRPQATPEQMKEFVVVSIPSRLESLTCGGGYGVTSGYCNIEVYVRLKKSGMEDVAKMDEMVGDLLDMLPYRDEFVLLAKPQVMLRGSDGLGFSAVLIRTELVIK